MPVCRFELLDHAEHAMSAAPDVAIGAIVRGETNSGPEYERDAWNDDDTLSLKVQCSLFRLKVTLRLQYYAAVSYREVEAAVNKYFGGQLERYSNRVRHLIQQLLQQDCLDALMIGYCVEDDELAHPLRDSSRYQHAQGLTDEDEWSTRMLRSQSSDLYIHTSLGWFHLRRHDQWF